MEEVTCSDRERESVDLFRTVMVSEHSEVEDFDSEAVDNDRAIVKGYVSLHSDQVTEKEFVF